MNVIIEYWVVTFLKIMGFSTGVVCRVLSSNLSVLDVMLLQYFRLIGFSWQYKLLKVRVIITIKNRGVFMVGFVWFLVF